ncbi:uncharacterized protein EV420DRAFT_1649614 [Desarmillaria tabescens]|uniref:Uncharacterized protein n=1 Tax=Armillaria tabescens TaxID=1929756 RepID=A0AA39MPW4_ARMTA|nr:uncharacterized protein EV420DRAFT_1649614 [Desarmillaria tabescens]KAK0442726.1 hypothetical protein EV420DRAFT_1649614 [Desarmillaria tabescens]
MAAIPYAIPTTEIPVTPGPKPKRTRTRRTIKRTDAAKEFRLKPADLDTLTPTRQRDNPYGGKVTFYKIDEVEALAERLREDPSTSQSLSRPPVTRKKKDGSITKTDAEAHYSLQPVHLDGIKPREVKKNPHDESRSMYIYNVVDVEELAKAVHGPPYRLPKRPAKSFTSLIPDLDEDDLYPGYHKWY